MTKSFDKILNTNDSLSAEELIAFINGQLAQHARLAGRTPYQFGEFSNRRPLDEYERTMHALALIVIEHIQTKDVKDRLVRLAHQYPEEFPCDYDEPVLEGVYRTLLARLESINETA